MTPRRIPFLLPLRLASTALRTTVPLASMLAHAKSSTPENITAPTTDQHNSGAKLNHLRFMVRRLLKYKSADDAYGYFTRQLASHASEREFVFDAYERIILIFLRTCHFSHAKQIYEDMHSAGLYSSSRTRAIMHAVELVQSPDYDHTSSKALFERLTPTLSLPSFTDEGMRALADILQHALHISPATCAELIEHYQDLHGDEKELSPELLDTLVRCHGESGSIDAALLHAAEAAEAAPYTSLLTSLSAAGRHSPATADTVLSHMATAHVTPDLPFFNALLSAAVRTKDFGTAFAVYGAILEHPAIMPDAFTFSSLFKAAQGVAQGSSARAHPVQAPPNARSPRLLFSEMMLFHMLNTRGVPRRRSPAVRASTLGVALGLFMRSRDYVAALVALRAFRTLELKPHAKVFRAVAATLLAHVRLDLIHRAEDDNLRWADRFLGTDVTSRLRPEDITHELIDQLLCTGTIGCAPTKEDVAERKDLGKWTRPPREPDWPRVPRLAVILGGEPEPREAKWDIKPLERLLSRAVLATLEDNTYSDEEALELVVGDAQRTLMPTLSRKSVIDLMEGRATVGDPDENAEMEEAGEQEVEDEEVAKERIRQRRRVRRMRKRMRGTRMNIDNTCTDGSPLMSLESTISV
ncbi:hypothetical protein EVG20_g6670 [Dentipellis fragilis]|uniref:Pentacotripeptide-repeat region of PRORP domain-containing protein n=1 Tax=Dentipellis fragilis TaxID=205917 RepID=A0A4Y9YJ20_9AGAM|nr:hypothetical protein EVG20_g6670 [Dentipellis fragilis]